MKVEAEQTESAQTKRALALEADNVCQESMKEDAKVRE